MKRQDDGRSTDRTRLAEKFITEHPHIKFKRTIARHLVDMYPDVFPDIEIARSCVRKLFLVNGSDHRESKHNLKFYEIPDEEQHEETWTTPYRITSKKLGVIGDLHGQFMDVSAVNCAISVLKSAGCTDLLINGDLVDNYYLSKWNKKTGYKTILQECDFMHGWLKEIRPEFENVYLKYGNHDSYIDRHFQNFPGTEKLTTLEERLGTFGLGIKTIESLQQIQYGDLDILHGHEKPGFFTPEYVAKSVITWWQKYSNKLEVKIMVNHFHLVDNFIARNLTGTFAYGHVVGCLCRRMAYNPYGRLQTGAAICENIDGVTKVENFEI